jgi:hypothetical protein
MAMPADDAADGVTVEAGLTLTLQLVAGVPARSR